MAGISAAEFNTDSKKAAFKKAVEDSLKVPATVKNIVAVDVSRRRRLLSSQIDVTYTLEMKVADGSNPGAAFKKLTDDLKDIIKDTNTLKDALASELGSSVVLDKTAYSVPTTFDAKVVDLPTAEEEGGLSTAVVGVIAAVVALVVAGGGYVFYTKSGGKGKKLPGGNGDDPLEGVLASDLPQATAHIVRMPANPDPRTSESLSQQRAPVETEMVATEIRNMNDPAAAKIA